MRGGGQAPLELTLGLLLVLGLGCGFGNRPAAPAPEDWEANAEEKRFMPAKKLKRVSPRGDCVRWLAPPVRLSPPDSDKPRHHPSITVLPENQILASWQIGRVEAAVAARVFGSQFGNATDEHIISPASDKRSTHPQVLATEDGRWVIYTHDPTGAVRLQELDLQGAAVGKPIVLVPGGSKRPGLYPDLVLAPDGRVLATWYSGHEDKPAAYSWAWIGEEVEGPYTWVADPMYKRGGPPTAFIDGDGTPWIIGTTVLPKGGWGEASILMWPVLGDSLGEARTVVTANQRFERPSVGVAPDGSVVLGWTSYSVAGGPWGALAQRLDPELKPMKKPRSLGRGPGRMVDLAVEGVVAAIAWEEPFEDDDVVMEVINLDSNKVVCGPVRTHILTAGQQTRATIDLWEDGGEVHGVVAWQSGDSRGNHEVWGRRFSIRK